MRVHASDAVFVRASRADVHAVLRDPAGYERWWPGVRTRGRGGSGARGAWTTLAHGGGVLRRRVVVSVRVTADRPADKGLHLACRGDFEGRAEWYYLDEPDGAVVHHVLDAATPGRGAGRRLARYRASVRAALDTLKDALEGDRQPGEEPDPALVAHQREAARALLPAASGQAGEVTR